MPELLVGTLRILAVIGGSIALYAAGFLYEDDEGRIQNRLEEWWIRLDDLKHEALSRHTAAVNDRS